MKTKPSLRRDSLEKAARKVLTAHVEAMGHGMGLNCSRDLIQAVIRFATRHGAKVRRNYENKISDLDELTKIQCSQGNWNYDGYMHGMANGMILALATMRGEDPKFLTAPKKWLRDRKLKRPAVAVAALTPRGPEKGRKR